MEQGPGVHQASEVLARLQVAEREHVWLADAEPAEEEFRGGGAHVAAASRREVPGHALGRDQDALPRDAEERAELVARVPRGHEHARRSLDRRTHADVQHRAVAQREPLRVPQERDVVDGDHRGRGSRERRRVGRVDDARGVIPGRRHEPDRQARDVGAAAQHDGVVGPDVDVGAGDGHELPTSELLEAAQQPAQVGLVAGLAGAEHVAVDQDAGGHEAGSASAPAASSSAARASASASAKPPPAATASRRAAARLSTSAGECAAATYLRAA